MSQSVCKERILVVSLYVKKYDAEVLVNAFENTFLFLLLDFTMKLAQFLSHPQAKNIH